MGHPTTDELFNELDALLREIRHAESDRGAVLISAAFLDSLLESRLREFFVADDPTIGDVGRCDELFSAGGPAHGFTSKIRLAYFLGLIGPGTYRALLLIKKIRNEMAHKRSAVSLSAGPFRDWCWQLPPVFGDDGKEWSPDSPREKFLDVSFWLMLGISSLPNDFARRMQAPDMQSTVHDNSQTDSQ